MKVRPVPDCPTGSTLEFLEVKGGGKRVCVKAGAPSYLRPLPQPGPNPQWPCNGDDPFHMTGDRNTAPKAKCFGSGGGQAATPAAPTPAAPTPAARPTPTPPTMNELRTKYLSKSAEYDAVIQQALTSNDSSLVVRIRQMNADVSTLLDQMIQALTFTKSDTPLLIKERDSLVEKLRRIQLDYNGLLVNTDSLETLRRIREQEGGSFKRDLYRYLLFFFIVCVGIVLMMLFVKKGSQSESTASSAATPRMTPPLM